MSRLAAVFLTLNAVWELLQVRRHDWWSEPWSRIALALLHCTAGDVLIGALALVFAIAIGGKAGRLTNWREDGSCS